MWQFLCGKAHGAKEARLISLKSAFELDNSIRDLANMPCGCFAERKHKKDNWVINKQ